MVEPDTGVRWQRSAWRAYWRWKSRRGPGRPHIPAAWQRLILRIATEHPRWRAVRIVGELRALGRVRRDHSGPPTAPPQSARSVFRPGVRGGAEPTLGIRVGGRDLVNNAESAEGDGFAVLRIGRPCAIAGRRTAAQIIRRRRRPAVDLRRAT